MHHPELRQMMSWTTNVLVLCHLGEYFSHDELQAGTLPAPFVGINAWLTGKKLGTLVRLDEHAQGRDGVFEAVVAASVFSQLPLEEFLQVTFDQPWEVPDAVQVMIMGEDDLSFAVHRHPHAMA
jgi:hypothetical protein